MVTKVYFITGSQYFRYDVAGDSVDAGYPKPIGANWKGFSAAGFDTGFDAAVNWPGGKVYCFKGSQYLRYDIATNQVDDGYPLTIADSWNGLAAAGFDSGIDAAINWGNGKVYFFKGDRYARYDIEQDCLDDGMPLSIADGWPGFGAAGFSDGIDGAVNWGDGKVFFFRGGQYLRYDIEADKVDDGYPLSVDENWTGFGPAWAGARIDAVWSSDGQGGAGTDAPSLSDSFFSGVKEVAGRLSCAPEDLLGVMLSESGVNPQAQNPHGKATGLIQFMPATLTQLGWNDGPDNFKSLSAEQQLPYVEKFYRPYRGQLTSAGRLYQATFLPATLPGSNEQSIIAAPSGPNADAYRDNSAYLDANKDGAITVSDLTACVNRVRQGARWQNLVQRLGNAG